MAEVGHNSAVAADELRAFVERVERLNEEIKALNADKSELYGEIKSRGFGAKIVRKIVALRAMDDTERKEQAAILELYAEALGMQGVLPL